MLARAVRGACGAVAQATAAQPRHALKKSLNPQYAACFSTGGDGFRPRRRVPPSYRPLKSRRVKPKGPLNPLNVLSRKDDRFQLTENGMVPLTPSGVDGESLINYDDELEAQYGPYIADTMRYVWRERQRGGPADVEEQLRALDYLAAAPGSTEDLVGERRAGLDSMNPKERKEFAEELDRVEQEMYTEEMNLGNELLERDDNEEEEEEVDPYQLAHGPWSETVIRVDRVQKVQRGGTMVRFRSLVVGGNTNGVAGFGIGKAASPVEATGKAVRMCKRNIFFVDRYLGSGLSYDLVGKQNSCRVFLRTRRPGGGISGHPLVVLILKYAGISDCSCKTHGNRNQFNVVRATFKALLTHESLEEIAMKRGKRLLNLERAKKLGI